MNGALFENKPAKIRTPHEVQYVFFANNLHGVASMEAKFEINR